MASSGSTIGTVIRWDDATHSGLVEAPDLPAPCWVDASVLHGDTALRAGQVVEVDWTTAEEGESQFSATRVIHRPDLQTGLGG